MPVSLYDMMRPAAIATGLGVGAGGERGLSLLASGFGGLAFGIAAFVFAGRVANLWFAHLANQPAELQVGASRAPASATSVAVVYVAVFFVLVLATVAGCFIGKWVLHELQFQLAA